jgi:MSHA biogenesis protein MshM
MKPIDRFGLDLSRIRFLPPNDAKGIMLAPIIDDAHLMSTDALRRLRLVFEDFPKNHNLVLVAQPELLYTLTLTVNEVLKPAIWS